MLRFGAAGKCTRAGSVPRASTGLPCTSPPPPCLRHQLGDGEIRSSKHNGSKRAGRALLSAAFVLCGVTQAPRCAQCKRVRPRCRLRSLIPIPPPRTHLPLLVRLRCKTVSVGPRHLKNPFWPPQQMLCPCLTAPGPPRCCNPWWGAVAVFRRQGWSPGEAEMLALL